MHGELWRMMWVVAVACGPIAPSRPSAGSTWIQVPTLSLQLQGPSDAKPKGTTTAAFVSNGAFMVNLFMTTPYSPTSAADQQARLKVEPGFAAITSSQSGATTWRFDYTLEDGTAGTVARIVVAGTSFDCGIHHVAALLAAQVATACATVKPL